MTAVLRLPARAPQLLGRVVDSEGSLAAAGVLRMGMGAVVVRHLWPDLTADVVPVERFHVPWWSFVPEPSPDLYRALVWAGVAAGVLMIVGLACRFSTAAAFCTVSYLLVVDLTAFAHNRAFLVWILFGLALLQTDRAASLDAVLARRRPPPTGLLWPLVMLRLVVTGVYLTSASTKAANPDWVGGRVLWDRVNRHEHRIPFDGWVHDVLTSRAFHHVLAPSAIAIEIFIALGLWHRRTRLAAIWVAIVFHGSIEITASVQTFSYSAIAALLIWVTPSERDRTIHGASGAFVGAVRRLDWLRRFSFEPAVTSGGGGGGGWIVVDRDGRMLRGRDATVLVLSRLPLTFPIAYPWLVARRASARSRGAGTGGYPTIEAARQPAAGA